MRTLAKTNNSQPLSGQHPSSLMSAHSAATQGLELAPHGGVNIQSNQNNNLGANWGQNQAQDASRERDEGGFRSGSRGLGLSNNYEQSNNTSQHPQPQRVMSSQNQLILNQNNLKRQLRQVHGSSVEPKSTTPTQQTVGNKPTNQSMESESGIRQLKNKQNLFQNQNQGPPGGLDLLHNKSKSPLKIQAQNSKSLQQQQHQRSQNQQNQIDNKSTERLDPSHTAYQQNKNTQQNAFGAGALRESSQQKLSVESIQNNDQTAVTTLATPVLDKDAEPTNLLNSCSAIQKDRAKNGSEPVGGLDKGSLFVIGGPKQSQKLDPLANQKQQSKGSLIDKFGAPTQKSQTVMNSPSYNYNKYNNSVPADKTGTGTAVDSIDPDEQEELLGDLQEGIQADDEDNDQIETERANGPSGSRKSEFHQLLLQGKNLSNVAANRNNNHKIMGSSFQNFNKNNGKRTKSYKSNIASQGNVLFQIKESYEGLNCSNLLTSEGGAESSQNGQKNTQSNSNHTISAFSKDQETLQIKNQNTNFASIGLGQGQMHQHPTMPDKIVTPSGAVINRPKSKHQQKKHRQQQAALNNQSQPASKFSELRKLQSQNTQSTKALDALKSVNQQEMLKQQMKNSFNFVAEEQENEDCGSDGARRNKRLIGKSAVPTTGFSDKLSTNNNIVNKGGIGTTQGNDESPGLAKKQTEDVGGKESSCHSHGQLQLASQQATPFKMGQKNDQPNTGLYQLLEMSKVAGSQVYGGDMARQSQSKGQGNFDPIAPQGSHNQQQQLTANSNNKIFKLQNKKGSIPMGSHSSQNSYRGGPNSNYFQQSNQVNLQERGIVGQQMTMGPSSKISGLGGRSTITSNGNEHQQSVGGQSSKLQSPDQQASQNFQTTQSICFESNRLLEYQKGQQPQFKQGQYFWGQNGKQQQQQPQNVYQNHQQIGTNSISNSLQPGSTSQQQNIAGGTSSGGMMVSNAVVNQKHNLAKFQDLSQSQDDIPQIREPNMYKIASKIQRQMQDEKNARGVTGANQAISKVNAQGYLKKFAITQSNFYMHPQEQLPQPNQRDQSGSLNARQHFDLNPGTSSNTKNQEGAPLNKRDAFDFVFVSNNNYKGFQQKNQQHPQNIYQPQSQLSYQQQQSSGGENGNSHDYYKQQSQQLMTGGGGGVFGHQYGQRHGQKNLTFQNSRQIKMGAPTPDNSKQTKQDAQGQHAYQNNTSYGYRDSQRDNSLNLLKSNGQSAQMAGNVPAAGVYNDHQYNNQMLDHLNNQQNRLRVPNGNHSLGRNTFYVSDYQLQKQSREFNNQSMGRRQKRLYGNGGLDVSTAQGSYNMNQETGSFVKPRAISRQADAHIRIEVHKDQRIIHHLQGEKQENMNLMFYNFNDFSHQSQGGGQGPNGRRPTAGGATNEGRRYRLQAQAGPQTQGGMRTQNNFYKAKGLIENEKAELNCLEQKVVAAHPKPGVPVPPGANIHEQNINHSGDRIPTRERQYRSAHLNVRRRDKSQRLHFIKNCN